MKKIIWSVAVLSLLLSCNSESEVELNPSEKKKSSNLAAGSQSEEELREAAQKRKEESRKRAEEIAAKQTTMEIIPAEFDFGNIPKEQPVSKVFKLKNTGDKPLTIQDAKASCGCTVPKKPEKPILPGETGDLEVTFTSKPNQAGQTISKNVTITANIPNTQQKLTIKGKVED